MDENFESLLAECRQGTVNVRADSRKTGAGDIFVAVSGFGANGGDYIADAVSRGAAHIVADAGQRQRLGEMFPGVGWAVCDNTREALARLAAARHGVEELPFKVVGITGTNGKTTCAWMLDYLFNASGRRTGLLGTIEYHWPGHREAAPLTTPGSLELYGMLGEMKKARVDVAVMEVSSHALDQERVAGIGFSGAIFTNLTQDHLDYHKDMETYFRAKAKLFLKLPFADKAMAVNSDDSYGRRIIELAPCALSFGLHKRLPGQRHLWGEIMDSSRHGMAMRMTLGPKRWDLRTPLIGAFNAANLLAVQALALEMGFEPAELAPLENFGGVPGRLERIDNPQGYHIFVDYAHTPDALSNALRSLRGAGFEHIVTVFGCGGNRDRDKRPLMGKAVAENSNVAILTSDNPRHEDPLAIMADVKPGLAKAKRVIYEADRRRATAMALELATPENAILIAGKGHEDYQIIGDRRNHYSDQEVVRELLGCE